MSVSEIPSEILPFAVDGVCLSPLGNVINLNTEDQFVCSRGQNTEKKSQCISNSIGFSNHLLFQRRFMLYSTSVALTQHNDCFHRTGDSWLTLTNHQFQQGTGHWDCLTFWIFMHSDDRMQPANCDKACCVSRSYLAQ